jgi:hypothetical protein
VSMMSLPQLPQILSSLHFPSLPIVMRMFFSCWLDIPPLVRATAVADRTGDAGVGMVLHGQDSPDVCQDLFNKGLSQFYQAMLTNATYYIFCFSSLSGIYLCESCWSFLIGQMANYC